MTLNVLQYVAPHLPLRQGHILLVDDEEHLRKLIGTFLEERGHRVTTAANLAEAETQLKQESFDLVLQDVVLPDGDGIDFVPTIHAIQPNVPVLIMTGFGDDETVLREARANGVLGYFSKFLPVNQLVMGIHRILMSSKRAGLTPAEATAA